MIHTLIILLLSKIETKKFFLDQDLRRLRRHMPERRARPLRHRRLKKQIARHMRDCTMR